MGKGHPPQSRAEGGSPALLVQLGSQRGGKGFASAAPAASRPTHCHAHQAERVSSERFSSFRTLVSSGPFSSFEGNRIGITGRYF